MQPMLVAVDGGGSGTRLWVLNSMARLVAEGEAGPSSVMAVGVDRAVQAVAAAARQAGLATGAADGSVAVVALTMAGVDREPEASAIRNEMAGIFPEARIVLEHDAAGALLGGTLGDPGILLLAGTGSISLSRGPDGTEVRAGGWGYLLDDAGSGHWIGREGIRRSLRAGDGRGRRTVLATALAQAAGVTAVTELVGPVHRGAFDRPAIARLAPIVARAADEGDQVATDIMEEAAADLALLVKAVKARSPWFADVEVVRVVAAGGLFGLGSSWNERLRTALAHAAPRARLTDWVKAPIVGAAYMAVQRFYEAIPAGAMDNLRQLRARSVEQITSPR